jgi:glycosyltransferase involved in cell wall biosynthesis
LENTKRHILFLCSWYPNPDEKSNGIFIRRHAQALSLHHHVTVVFAKSVTHVKEPVLIKNEEENFEEYLYFYPKLGHRLPVISQAQKFLKLKRAYKKLIDDLPKRTFDTIHVNTIFPAAIPALYALKKYPAAKLFITEHWSGYYPEDGNYKGTILTRYTKQLVAKARAIFVISEKLEQAMKSHDLKGTYHLIHNTVDTEAFKPEAYETNQAGVLQILHVSSLTEREKNISGIIAVAAELKKKQFSFLLTLVGENGTEDDAHKKSAAQHNLEEHITFSGYKNPEEIAEYMNRSDVFLLFSHFEGAPVVITEALACGLPVMSTDVGEVKKMIPEKMGMVLKSNNIKACTEALLNYRRTDFAAKAEMHAYVQKNYSPEAVCKEISAFYNLHS